jgi:hypothetical protein
MKGDVGRARSRDHAGRNDLDRLRGQDGVLHGRQDLDDREAALRGEGRSSIADRFEAPGPDKKPHSVIVRGDLDVDGLEWPAHDAVSVLVVEGQLRARYVWLYGDAHVRIAAGVEVEDVLAASGGGLFEVVAGGIRARAVLQQYEHTIVARKGKLEALVVGDEDQVDAVSYAADELDITELLVWPVIANEEDGCDELAVRKLLRAKKDVLRARLPRTK